jgi:hypothetical protein
MKSLVGLANFVAAAIAAWLVYGRDATERPATILSDGRVEFPPDRLTFAALLLLEVPAAWYAVRTFQHGFQVGWSLLPAIFLGWAALVHLVSYPGTVVVTRDGLEQFYWIRMNQRLRWTDIREIRSGADLKIIGEDGSVIVHSRFLADRERLMSEIRRYCADELPPDFPKEPRTED